MCADLVFGWGIARGLVFGTSQGALNAICHVDFDVRGLGKPHGEAKLEIWPLKMKVVLRATLIFSGQILNWASPRGVPRPQTSRSTRKFAFRAPWTVSGPS